MEPPPSDPATATWFGEGVLLYGYQILVGVPTSNATWETAEFSLNPEASCWELADWLIITFYLPHLSLPKNSSFLRRLTSQVVPSSMTTWPPSPLM